MVHEGVVVIPRVLASGIVSIFLGHISAISTL